MSMRAARLRELEEMAGRLLETARKLAPGQDRHNALQEIASARETDANRELRDPGAGTLRIFLLALIGFVLLDWILFAPG
jgi:hypothetical protein